MRHILHDEHRKFRRLGAAAVVDLVNWYIAATYSTEGKFVQLVYKTCVMTASSYINIIAVISSQAFDVIERIRRDSYAGLWA